MRPEPHCILQLCIVHSVTIIGYRKRAYVFSVMQESNQNMARPCIYGIIYQVGYCLLQAVTNLSERNNQSAGVWQIAILLT
jgi:hypothetical protein